MTREQIIETLGRWQVRSHYLKSRGSRKSTVYCVSEVGVGIVESGDEEGLTHAEAEEIRRGLIADRLLELANAGQA